MDIVCQAGWGTLNVDRWVHVRYLVYVQSTIYYGQARRAKVSFVQNAVGKTELHRHKIGKKDLVKSEQPGEIAQIMAWDYLDKIKANPCEHLD